MKRALLILLLPLFLGVVEGQELESVIDQVTVFEDRARVDRSASIDLSAGESRIVIPDLPLTLNSGSVMASFEGGSRSGNRVVGVRLERAVEERDQRDEVAALEDRLRELRREESAHMTRVEIVAKRRALLGEFSELLLSAILDRSAQIASSDGAALLNAEEWLSDELLRAEDRLAVLERESLDRTKEQETVQAQLQSLHARAWKVSYSAVVQVISRSGGESVLQLSYDVPDATWTPVYEARLDESSGVVIWSSGAEIQQRTNEDWGEVELVLSTQRSSLGLAPPTLVPMQVRGRPTASRRAGLVSQDAAASLDEAAPMEDAEDGGFATIEGDAAEARFRVPVRSSIPADGRSHRVPLLEAALPADLAYEAIPRLSPHTYRRGTLENLSGAPFLPGTVRVFREGTYVGSTEISSVPAGGSFRLSFGVEGRIVAHRIERADRDRTVGTFSKGEKRTIGHEFSVKSTIPGGATLVLLDQVPVSEIEGVEIEIEDSPLAPTVDAEGICRWEVVLQPGQERRIPFEYSVEVDRGVEFSPGQIAP